MAIGSEFRSLPQESVLFDRLPTSASNPDRSVISFATRCTTSSSFCCTPFTASICPPSQDASVGVENDTAVTKLCSFFNDLCLIVVWLVQIPFDLRNDSQVGSRMSVIGNVMKKAVKWMLAALSHRASIVGSLTARAARKSLVLFDEPEMHLHPPLTAALMQAIRIIFEEVNAFCIVATHSPVVVQETLARHVRIVTRAGDTLHFRQPKLETFGENVGLLTYDILGLVASSTDFHEVLDLLVDGGLELDTIDDLFTPALSGQARGYVLSKLAGRAKQK